jgi:hypothetical protein
MQTDPGAFRSPELENTIADRMDPLSNGAGNGIRTRDFNLGKVALYH